MSTPDPDAAGQVIRDALTSDRALRADTTGQLARIVHDALVAATILPAPPLEQCRSLRRTATDPDSLRRCRLTDKHVEDHQHGTSTWTDAQAAGLLQPQNG